MSSESRATVRIAPAETVSIRSKPNDESKPNIPQEGLDSGWPAYLAAAMASDPDLDKNYGIKRLAGDYARLPIKKAKAIEFATGHESEELFRIGYMLLIVQECETYTLSDLAHVMSVNWVMPTDDLDLIDRVRDMMFSPCSFARQLSQSNFQHFAERAGDPLEARSFKDRLEYVRAHPLDFPRNVLSVSEIKAVLCAEIWCTWAFENRSPLPSEKEFIDLFGPDTKVQLTAFVTRLEKAFACEEVEDYLLRWYGFDTVLLTRVNDLVDLVQDRSVDDLVDLVKDRL